MLECPKNPNLPFFAFFALSKSFNAGTQDELLDAEQLGELQGHDQGAGVDGLLACKASCSLDE